GCCHDVEPDQQDEHRRHADRGIKNRFDLFLLHRRPLIHQPARCPRKITPVVNSENPINDRKKIRSRESKTPRWKPSKCGMTLMAATPLTIQGFAHWASRLVTGGKPARIKNKQSTTERMKLTT